jgi:TPR repeat protein
MSTYAEALEVISKYKEAKAKNNKIMMSLHEKKAVKLLEKAANEGDTAAMHVLARYYSWGKEFNDFEFRMMEVRNEEYEPAIQWLKKAADKGSIDAMLLLGKCFMELAKHNRYEKNNNTAICNGNATLRGTDRDKSL